MDHQFVRLYLEWGSKVRIVISDGAAEVGVGNASVMRMDFQRSPLVKFRAVEECLESLRSADFEGSAKEQSSYRQVLGKLGYPDVEPAGEKLQRVIKERGLRSYGLLVDVCNIVAAHRSAGIGLHDVTNLQDACDEFHVWRANGTERIMPAFRDKSKVVPAGDLVYGIRGPDRTELLAWLGRRDTDSAVGQISESTRVALVVVLGHANTSIDDTAKMCKEIAETFQRSDSRNVSWEFLPR